jgi:AcrR family transcriptional regulator
MAEQSARTRGRPKDAMAPEARRAQLLDAATAYISAEGPNASMDAIAASAGVTKPVLYAHFGDKAGLASAVASEVGERLAEKVASQFDPTVEPYEQLRGAIRVFVEWVTREPYLFQFLLSSTPGGDTHSDVLAITTRISDVVTPAIELLYRVSGRDTSPADTYAHGIVGFVYLAVEQWLQLGEDDDDALIDVLARFVWAGLIGSDAVR